MSDENPQLTINFKKVGIIVSAIAGVIGLFGVALANFGGYHEQFADRATVEVQMNEINVQIVTLAIQRYEDEIMGYNFLIETDGDTPLTRVNKSNAESRLADLKSQLSELH